MTREMYVSLTLKTKLLARDRRQTNFESDESLCPFYVLNQLFNCQLQMTNITSYCPLNVTFLEIWKNHSLNQCFFDTISSSVIAGYILIFGITQLVIYRKYGTRIEGHRLQKSFFYILQLFLLILLPVLNIVRLFLRWKVYDPQEVYGYMVR